MHKKQQNGHISTEKIRQGDVNEFGRMFHTYYKDLCLYAEKITGCAHYAEDIVCNMFVRIWEKREQLHIHTNPEAYIVSAVYHDSINYLRRLKTEDRYREDIQYTMKYADLLHPESSENPLADILTKELSEHIDHAIQSLPKQCREVFILNKIEGLSYEEVAQRLDVTINTVRTQITRAMKKMRAVLSPFVQTGRNK